MTKSFGGRARQYQPRTRRRPPRAPAAVFPSLCLAESFDGGSWPIGPDLAWDESHIASAEFYHFAGSVLETDGSDSTKRTLHVVGNQATLRTPDISHLDGPPQHGFSNSLGNDIGWRTIQGYARTAADLPSTDMRVTGTVSAILSSGFGLWYLGARIDPTYVSDDWIGQYFAGIYASFEDSFVEVDVYYSSPSVSGDIETASLFSDGSWLVTPAPGDELTLEVTGTGASTRIVASVNGVAAIDADAATIEAEMFGSDTIDDAPLGLRASFGLWGRGESTGSSITVAESFTKANGDPVGSDLGTWSSMLPGGHDTIDTNRFVADALNVYAGVMSPVDHPNIGGRAFIISGVLGGSSFAGVPAGSRFTVLANVDGTDYTDWTGIGCQFTYVSGNTWNIVMGSLNPGDTTGALTGTTGGNIDTTAQGAHNGFDVINGGSPFQWVVWAGPVDDSGVGTYAASVYINNDNLPIIRDMNFTGNAPGPDHRFGAVIFSPTGSTNPISMTSLQGFQPAFFSIWNYSTPMDDTIGLDNFSACRA